jgi:hypothetical protein
LDRFCGDVAMMFKPDAFAARFSASAQLTGNLRTRKRLKQL